MRTTSPALRGVLVRRFGAADERFVRDLSERAFGEYSQGSGAHVIDLAGRAGAMVWVACEDGEPLGFVLLGHDAQDFCIAAIAVKMHARGRGVGSRLLSVAEREARAQGARRLWLMTADSNVSALALFLRHGFRIVARRRRFYQHGQDACRLEKPLLR